MNERSIVSGMDPRRISEHARLFSMNELLIRILHGRGYDTPEKIEAYLYPRLSGNHSPFLLDGMYDAVALIKKAFDSNWKIGIFADSDLDGITSLAVFQLLLCRMKKEAFIRYLKNDENYGLTNEIIDEFKANGVRLIITVDSGTRDIAEISYARSLNIDVIVTDHHEQESILPDALVINPKKAGCGYPFKHLAGVGVALKVCMALLMSYQPSFKKYFMLIAESDRGYMLSVIRDGLIEETCSVADCESIIEAIHRFNNYGAIIVHDDMSLVNILSESIHDTKIYDLFDFTSRIVKKELSGIEHFIRISASRNISDEEKMSFVSSIFLNAQIFGSEKIADFINSALGLVAIGSIADVISLVDENRLLVKRGIEILNQKKHLAISLLSNGEPINSRAIGWSIAPLLNTPGRIGKTELAVRFFLENDRAALKKTISEIRSLNDDRRLFINEFCSSTLREIGQRQAGDLDRLLVIKTDRIPDGYAGLVANRISDETGLPTIVTVLPGKQGLVKGSGRSRSGGKFFSIVERFRDRFDRIGGHENAFGFTVKADDIDEIMASINCSMEDATAITHPSVFDCELHPIQITRELIDELSCLEPFGSGNEEPIFISRNIIFKSFMIFGKNHGKYVPECNNGITAIGWNKGDAMREFFESGRPLDIMYRLENNSFNGTISPRMIIQSIQYNIP